MLPIGMDEIKTTQAAYGATFADQVSRIEVNEDLNVGGHYCRCTLDNGQYRDIPLHEDELDDDDAIRHVVSLDCLIGTVQDSCPVVHN